MARILLAFVFVGIWLLFLSNAPERLVSFVCLGIAGWQVGTWCARLSDYFLDK